MHTEISIDGQKIIRVYDGKSSGWMINPFADTKDVQPLPSEDLKNISDESDFDGPLVDYKAKGNQIELAGKKNLDDKPADPLNPPTKNLAILFSLFVPPSSFLF